MIEFPYSYPFDKAKNLPGLLRWASRKFEFLAYFEGNGHQYPGGPFDNLFFAGNTPISESEVLYGNRKSIKAGILSYELKNQIENLESSNPAFFPLPTKSFFEPEVMLRITEKQLFSAFPLSEEILSQFRNPDLYNPGPTACSIAPQISREEYLQRIETLQDEIRQGNTYEVNFCQAFSGIFESWDPVTAFLRLNELSTMPFAGLYKARQQWLVSASPERFLRKTSQTLLAQPIKGTVRRGANPSEDQTNRERLLHSEKERAENLMITDLTRNDLARVSATGSVRVEELFGIYSLPRVHQMISSVSSTLRPEVSFGEILQATFPMGSMTGAPKISTMRIIDREESFQRGWFSGAFGWIDADGDFDFSVVIRSVVADLEAKKLYFGVGSAITIDASAAQEYEECALKAQAILELLRGN
jgi:para-aminobenzoate synthetase component 1